MEQQNNSMTSDRNNKTEKELLYLKDFLSWELLAMKKCHHSVQSCTDPDIQNVIKQIGRKHQLHYDTLLNHLQ